MEVESAAALLDLELDACQHVSPIQPRQCVGISLFGLSLESTQGNCLGVDCIYQGVNTPTDDHHVGGFGERGVCVQIVQEQGIAGINPGIHGGRMFDPSQWRYTEGRLPHLICTKGAVMKQ